MNDEILQDPGFSEEKLEPAIIEEIVTEETEVPAPDTAEEEVQAEKESVRRREKKEDWKKQLFRDARDVLYMLAMFMLVYILCFRTVVVVGNSMYDTLLNGDRLLLVSNILYRQPERGDVIVASKDSFRGGECIIKRVIATGGQEVDIDFEEGIVYVDGEAIPEPYLYSLTHTPKGMKFPLLVPEGCLFVMGDNRMNSTDSRSPSIGFIDEREVLGKAIFIMIPGVDAETEVRDFSRIGVIG